MFESRLHWRNTWIEDFSKEIESNDYSIVLKPKYRELYLEIHQYKNTFVKHIQLFDSSLRFCVYIMRGLIGIFVWTTTIFRKKKKKNLRYFWIQWNGESCILPINQEEYYSL